MAFRDVLVRGIRGTLIFAAGLLVGGAVVYNLAAHQGSYRGLAEVDAQPVGTAADPALPPSQPVGSQPRVATPPDVPMGQFDENGAAQSTPLFSRSLLLPVQGVAVNSLQDTFNDARSGGRVHDAIDIMAPAGTPVLAADDGMVVKLFESKQGGTTLYQFDPSSQVAYYYAHLQGYAPGLKEQQAVKRGDVLGFVGGSGNADPSAPHLHFAVMVLGPDKNWWKGAAINPYPLLGGRAMAPSTAPVAPATPLPAAP